MKGYVSQKQFQKLIDKHQHYLNEDVNNWRSCKAVIINKLIEDVFIKDANLSESMSEYTYFVGVSFINVDFLSSIFAYCEFDNCKFVGCTFNSTFFKTNEFTDCVFTGVDFGQCVFDECYIKRNTVMSDELANDLGIDPRLYHSTKISNTKFYFCEFTEAFVESMTFSNNTMDDCHFCSCDFGLFKTLENGVGKYVDHRTSFHNCRFDASCENIPDLPLACPSTGAFIGYKKVQLLKTQHNSDIGSYAIAVLKIPANAKRLSANGNKCRCSKAKVLWFETLHGTKIDNPENYTFTSIHDHYFGYKVGETVKPVLKFCEDRWNECSSGIHFFMNREDAVLY